MQKNIKKIIKTIFPGVAWQHPVINSLFRLIDPIDYLTRKFTNLSVIPPYSIRIRSNGVTGQFGGKRFVRNGNLIAQHLKDYCHLKPEDKVMEVGCGCGRTAIALGSYLNNEGFTGVDIEKTSLNSCKSNKYLIDKEFKFVELDVYNCVFLISVFTHMMPKDIDNYIQEISRILKIGGTCLISTFLMDRGTTGKDISFPYQGTDYYTNNIEMPEIAVGYTLDFYKRIAAKCNMQLVDKPVFGTWFETTSLDIGNRFSQDIIILQKKS